MTERKGQPKKLTTAQLTERLLNIEQNIAGFLGAVSSDMNQVITAVSALLEHNGLLGTITCKDCGTDLTYPDLPGVGKPANCPACSSDISWDEEE